MALFPQTKSAKVFWTIGLLALGFFLYAIGNYYYDNWQGKRQVEKMAQALKQAEQEIFNRKASDKIGGKTPQETLDMYIKAVEAGDYDLASKYFVVEKQEKELEILNNSPKKNIENIINLMKNTYSEFDRFSGDEEEFSVHNPILVSFILYPSGNWKIEEI